MNRSVFSNIQNSCSSWTSKPFSPCGNISTAVNLLNIYIHLTYSLTSVQTVYYSGFNDNWDLHALTATDTPGVYTATVDITGETPWGFQIVLDEAWAMPAIVLVSVWKDMGFFGLILLSGMIGIDRGYYEAASLDGAGPWARFWRITLPLMTPAIFYVLIVSLINAFQLFPQIMIMTDGGPNGATQVMVERIYKYGFRYYRMGYAAAFSWILFVIIMVCTWVQMKGQERWVNYDS